MSKIQTIQPNHFGDQKNRNVNRQVIPPMTRKNYTNLSFGGPNEEAIERGSKEILGAFGRFGNFLKNMKKSEGEVQNQLWNAAFTTTLAPIMIAKNPFSKEDKKRREYTALRQPVSAVTAIGFGLLITMPVNNFLENIASKGYINSIDLRVKPDDKFLKRQFKKESADAKAAGKFEEFKKKYTNKKGEFSVESYTGIKQAEAKELFVKLIGEEPENLKKDTKYNGYEKFIEKNNMHNIDFKDFMKERFKIEFFEDGNLKEEAFKKKLNEIKAMDFLRETGLVKSEKTKDGKIKVGHFSEDDLRRFLLNDSGKKHGVSVDQGKHISNAVEYSVGDAIVDQETITLKHMFDRLGITKPEVLFEKEVDGKKQNRKLMNVLTDFVDNHLDGLTISSGKEGSKPGQYYAVGKAKQMVTEFFLDMHIARKIDYFKNYKKYAGIVVSLVSLPFSCGALNWAYPRFVSTFFPSLDGNRAQKGGNK